MPLFDITRESFELLNQNYRAAEIVPGAVPPARGDEAVPQNGDFPVADDFLQIVPFVDAGEGIGPHARSYQIRARGDLVEPDFTARPTGTAWQAGATSPFGQELEFSGARFKKISALVRTDGLMTKEGRGSDMLDAQIGLAATSIKRSLSEALFHSRPTNDDESELAGLPFFLTPGAANDVAYDPAKGLMAGLSEMQIKCSPSDGDLGGHVDVIVTSARVRLRLLHEIYQLGSTPIVRFSPVTGREELHLHGLTPVIVGRVPEPGGPNGTTVAWALKLFGPTGIRVLHLGGSSTEYGVRVENITTVAGLDAQGEAESATRGVEVFGVYSVFVPEPNSIARLSGIPIVDPFTGP